MPTIALTKGQVAHVSERDAVRVRRFKWYARHIGNCWYAYTTIAGRTVALHRLILCAERDDPQVDHIDGDGLNNIRSNLRFATSSQQMANSRPRALNTQHSRYKGVSRHRPWKITYWTAQVRVNGQKIVRYTRTERDAALAYNELAREHFGEFARLNQVD